ncbi:unconventional myosin-IXb-like [Dendronephthya gigantea]|uniref:unconventional myosin-IXb-like n=1 Tax=Dendronephthya gigantea TaxID=151771 RepID=UPI00106A638C|nr:unconventional myosin-IXb-like [Dendronephthya gigantea]
MTEISRIGFENVNSDNLLALKDLFEQLMMELANIKRILSNNNVSKNSQLKSGEDTQNIPVPGIPGPNDLVHLKGPLTEDTIIATLEARFNAKCYHTMVGPVQLILNPFNSETKDAINCNSKKSTCFRPLIMKSLEQLNETRMPQIMILSGESGSGKSYTAQMIIKELMNITCGTAQSDLLRQLDASITVLDILGKARTTNSPESSNVAFLYQFHFHNNLLQKTRIKYIPLCMARIVHPRKDESNFRIFYQLFAGLCPNDRAKLQLQTHSANELRYLYNYPSHQQSEIELLKEQFQTWKSSLHVLGIPFADVTKLLAAILLLGNVHFTEKSPRVLEVQGGDYELKAVAVLLGVAYTTLFRGLTKKLKVMKSDATIQSCTAKQANANRDALAKTLYLRMLSAIVRRCNCSRKSTTEYHHLDVSSAESFTKSHDSLRENRSLGPEEIEISEKFAFLDDEESWFGIADVFGFDTSSCNRMEQLASNLCSETIQHFYTTHIFKSAEGFCREEDIQNEADVDYFDNSQCIELLTCQETGILTYLDQESLKDGAAEDFVEKLRAKHVGHEKFFSTNCKSHEFGVCHYNAKVIYDAGELLRGNIDSVTDDVIQMFSAEQCSFGFVVHLFISDLKTNISDDLATDRVRSFTSSPVQSFAREFQERLDELLKALIHADPWFIFCLKSNTNGRPYQFDAGIVSRQIKSLQIFETVHLLRSGYTHRMRHIPFAQRYFVHDKQMDEKDALEIAQSYQMMLTDAGKENSGKIMHIGRKHVFFSEILWQDLEKSRPRGSQHSRSKTNLVSSSEVKEQRKTEHSSVSSPVFRNEMDGKKHSPNTPPAIPKRRGYTVIDNKKIAFPQTRIMTNNYRDTTNGQDVSFSSGESVRVVGASPKAGYLAVEARHKTGWVPYNLTTLMTDDVI